MKDKCDRNRVEMRPHFKTHQSEVIGKIFRKHGIQKITVSSVQMALYFAKNGFRDILIAFPVNLREKDDMETLIREYGVELHLLVQDERTVHWMGENFRGKFNIWIKVDINQNKVNS